MGLTAQPLEDGQQMDVLAALDQALIEVNGLPQDVQFELRGLVEGPVGEIDEEGNPYETDTEIADRIADILNNAINRYRYSEETDRDKIAELVEERLTADDDESYDAEASEEMAEWVAGMECAFTTILNLRNKLEASNPDLKTAIAKKGLDLVDEDMNWDSEHYRKMVAEKVKHATATSRLDKEA